MTTDSAINELAKIQSWPDVALVFSLVIVVGYCFRFWKSFPNSAIPTVVILFGAIGMMLLSPGHPDGTSARIWHCRNFIVGVIIGFLAWMGHALVVSRIENWLSAKFDSVGKLLNKPGPKTGVDSEPGEP